MFLYSDSGNTLKHFCYSAEDTDPLHSVGVSELLILADNADYHQFSWHPSGKTVLYSYSVGGEDAFHINAVDIDNTQIFTISETYTEPVFSIDSSGKYIISHCGEDICTVTFQE